MSSSASGAVAAAPAAVRRWAAGVRWYLRQLSGEARWDEHVERCRCEGREPMTRREFERHRSEVAEAHPQRRCC